MFDAQWGLGLLAWSGGQPIRRRYNGGAPDCRLYPNRELNNQRIALSKIGWNLGQMESYAGDYFIVQNMEIIGFTKTLVNFIFSCTGLMEEVNAVP